MCTDCVNFSSDSTVLPYYEMGPAKVLVRLHAGTCSSESLLVTFAIRTKISLAG